MHMTVDVSTTVRNRIIGSLCVMIGMTLSSINEVIVKLADLTVAEIIIGRFALQLLFAALWWNTKKPSSPTLFEESNSDHDDGTKIDKWYGDKPYTLNIWLRGICFAMMMLMFYLALIQLPIGDLQCIFYQSPVLVVYIGAVWLKEELPSRWILLPSTVLTFTGILIVSQPTFLMQFIDPSGDYEPLNVYGILCACAAAVFYALVCLLTRTAADTHFLQIEFASSICLICLVMPTLLTINTYFIREEWIGSWDLTQWTFDAYSDFVIFVISIFGFGLMLFLVTGYQMGEATYVSWLEYVTIPLGFINQSIFFNDIPNQYEIIGSVLIVVGCLLPLIKQVYVYRRIKVKNTHDQLEFEAGDTDEEQQFIT
eukprot:249488_1